MRLVYGLGMGITMAPVTESIMGSLPPSRAGVGSAVNDTTRQTGGALGVAVLGSVFLAQYHSHMDGRTSPASVLRARRGLDRGLAAGRAPLGGHAGAQLREVAREAFLTSIRVTFTFATVIILVAALARSPVSPGPGRGFHAATAVEPASTGRRLRRRTGLLLDRQPCARPATRID